MTNVFYQGFEAKIVANIPSDASSAIIQLTDDLTLSREFNYRVGTQLYVKKADLEPCIYDKFLVGTHVRNKNGSMIGVISAFEYHTNKAVVISDKIDRYQNKSTRYVYGVYDLEEYDANAFEFLPGHWYKINNRTKLMAVESVFNFDDVMLFDEAGKIVYRSLPKKTNLDWLNVKHSITCIKRL